MAKTSVGIELVKTDTVSAWVRATLIDFLKKVTLKDIFVVYFYIK